MQEISVYLYPGTPLNSLTSSTSFLVAYLGFSVYYIMSSTNNDSFIFLFQFALLLFLFLLRLPRLGLLKLCWIIVVRTGTLVLFLRTRKCFQFFTIENDVYCGFVIYDLYYVEVGSLYAHFLESFYHKWVLNFVKSFFCTCWNDHIFFIFQFVNMVYHIDWFAYSEESLYPEIKPTG